MPQLAGALSVRAPRKSTSSTGQLSAGPARAAVVRPLMLDRALPGSTLAPVASNGTPTSVGYA